MTIENDEVECPKCGTVTPRVTYRNLNVSGCPNCYRPGKKQNDNLRITIAAMVYPKLIEIINTNWQMDFSHDHIFEEFFEHSAKTAFQAADAFIAESRKEKAG